MDAAQRASGPVGARAPGDRASTALAHAAWLEALSRALLVHPLTHPTGVRLPGWAIAALLVGGQLLGAALARRTHQALAYIGVGLAAAALTLCGVFGPWAIAPWSWEALGAVLSGWEGGLPAGAPVVLVALAAWGLGVLAGRWEYAGAHLGFWGGAVGLGALLIVAGPEYLAGAGVTGSLVVGVFALSGLTALALQAVYEVGSLERALAVPHLGFSRPWLSAWGLALGLVFLAGALAAGAFSPATIERAWSALVRAWEPAGTWLAGQLAECGEVLGALWGLILAILARIIPPLALAALPEEDVPPPRTGPFRLPQEGERDPGIVGLAFSVALLALVVWLVGRAMARRGGGRRLPHRGDAAHDDERETLWSTALLGVQVRDLLRRLRRPRRAPYLAWDGEERRRRAVRRLYRRLLAALARCGAARPAGCTPQDLARRLGPRLREEAAALAALTQAYQAARYGPAPPEDETVARAEGAWCRLEPLLRPATARRSGHATRRPQRPRRAATHDRRDP